MASFYAGMDRDGVRLWLMGGWGVDALLRRRTRDHHDVDVLVEVASLERFRRRLDADGYAPRHLWDDETWWVGDPGWCGAAEQPTASVYAHPDGREVDVHAVRVGYDLPPHHAADLRLLAVAVDRGAAADGDADPQDNGEWEPRP